MVKGLVQSMKQLIKKGIHNYDVKYTVNGETYTDNYSFFFKPPSLMVLPTGAKAPIR